jgi:hypothetical protein
MASQWPNNYYLAGHAATDMAEPMKLNYFARGLLQYHRPRKNDDSSLAPTAVSRLRPRTCRSRKVAFQSRCNEPLADLIADAKSRNDRTRERSHIDSARICIEPLKRLQGPNTAVEFSVIVVLDNHRIYALSPFDKGNASIRRKNRTCWKLMRWSHKDGLGLSGEFSRIDTLPIDWHRHQACTSGAKDPGIGASIAMLPTIRGAISQDAALIRALIQELAVRVSRTNIL